MDRERYIAEVLRTVRERFEPDDELTGGMTTARLGMLLSQSLGVPPITAGYLKLTDLLLELEGKGVLRTSRTRKGAMCVLPPLFARCTEPAAEAPRVEPAMPEPVEATRCVGATVPMRPFRTLRSPLWHAFVAASPPGRRFLNRRSGDVAFGARTPPEPESDWVEVVPLDSDHDRDRAREFVESRGIEVSGDVQAALNSPRWYSELPRVLPPEVGTAWKRHRTAKVVELAEDLRHRHGLPNRIVFDERPAPAPVVSQSALTRHSGGLRDLLLATVARMSTAELLALPIPCHLLVSELRSDLLER